MLIHANPMSWVAWPWKTEVPIPVVPRKAVAEVSKIGNL